MEECLVSEIVGGLLGWFESFMEDGSEDFDRECFLDVPVLVSLGIEVDEHEVIAIDDEFGKW